MSNGNILSVGIPYESEFEEGGYEKGVDFYWAIKPPTDYWTYTPANGEARDHEFTHSYRIMGSQDVVISSKDDIRGYRELLDYIEREMGDE